MGSPTALADAAVEERVVGAVWAGPHGLYIPAGALWGGQDVQKMADRGTLRVGMTHSLIRLNLLKNVSLLYLLWCRG